MTIKASVIVVAFNMPREIPRTVHSLAPSLQRGVGADDYEIILVDNGSTRPFDDALCRTLALNLVIHRMEPPAPPSPARAVNQAIRMARGDLIGVLIDGARMVTPGFVDIALLARRLHHRPVIATLGFHIGPDLQRVSIEKGYNQQVEDELLERTRWQDDPYRLFDISVLAGASPFGYLAPPNESNGLYMPRALWEELGGFEERFVSPGGGLVNPDLFKRAVTLPDSQTIMLLGEGTFHQVHGGIATNNPAPPKQRWRAEYQAIRGEPYKPAQPAMLHVGHFPLQSLGMVHGSITRLRQHLASEPPGQEGW
jgi:Glycosyl transferase family 2